MSNRIANSGAANVLFSLAEARAGQSLARGKEQRPEALASPVQRGTALRPSVSPSLLSEIQAIVFPAGIVFASFAAKIVFFDIVLHTAAPDTFYLGAGVLAAIVMALIGGLSRINATADIVAGEVKHRVIIMAASLSFMLLLWLFQLLKVSDSFSGGWFALWYVFSLAFLIGARLRILLWARLLRAESRLLQRVAIYGSPDLAARVARELTASDPDLFLAGIYSDNIAPGCCAAPSGGMHELIAAAQSGACDRVVLAMPSSAKDKIVQAAAQLEVLPIDVQLCPDGITVPCQAGSFEGGSLVLLDLQNRPLSPRGILIKAAVDYVLGAIALIALSPVMLAAAIAIKLDSRGPVLFIQSRHGYNHRIVRVMKFRSMTVAEDGPVVTQAVRGDKRVTRVGRFLRRTSLDELPQLFNVLKGELSLVGPRPHAVTHNASYTQILTRYANRHKVKPGITGWAQVNGCRGETKTPEDMRKRVEFDLQYIKNWSLWLDVQILARTLLVPFYSSNAY